MTVPMIKKPAVDIRYIVKCRENCTHSYANKQLTSRTVVFTIM
jgi:hypothetical protein